MGVTRERVRHFDTQAQRALRNLLHTTLGTTALEAAGAIA